MISLDDVRRAAATIEGVAHRTPVITSRTLDGLTGAGVFLKAENLQRAGAFKFRGAFTKISSLEDAERRRGVVAFSSGNHAQAVALAASLLGTSAVIVMPTDAPATKLAATRGYGAEVVSYDRYADDRAAIASDLAEKRGLTLVPPYDDPTVMAGQGTAALELLEAHPDLDLLLVPVGGGGLIAGSGTVAVALRPGIRVVGVEPAAGDDTRRSLEAGERIRLPAVPATIADGLQLDQPGLLTFEINRRLVEGILTVTDEQIVDAMRLLFERCKLVVEPSGAVPVAALLGGGIDVGGLRVGAILSGGNVGADRFATLMGDRARP